MKYIKYGIIGIAVLSLLAIGFYLYLNLSEKCWENKMFKGGDQIVSKIENFKTKNHRLPITLDEIGIEEKMEGPYYYTRKDSINYILSFIMGMDEDEIYDSQERKWR